MQLRSACRLARRVLPDHADPPCTTAFMHVPKTAGSAIVAMLSDWQAGNAVYGYDESIFGEFSGFDGLAPDLRRAVFVGDERPPSGTPLVMGHMAAATLRAISPGVRLMTVLREPRSRLVSHWLYWRGQSDAELQIWGGWRSRVLMARRPLSEFLSLPSIACQTDNLATRMLLWPHPAIPAGGFISPNDDAALVALALERLDAFAFADVLENPCLETNLQTFLRGDVRMRRVNETKPVPEPYRVPFAADLRTEPTLALLDQLSRLDRVLWSHVLARVSPAGASDDIAEQSFARSTRRHAQLLAA